MRRWTNKEIQRYLGAEQDCFLTWPTDEPVRLGAASHIEREPPPPSTIVNDNSRGMTWHYQLSARGERWIRRLPFSFIRAYVFFFKGLQQFGLLFYRSFPPVERVSLIGATLSGNRGAEAMLVTTIARAREALPTARYVVHSYFPQRDRAICTDMHVDIVDAGPRALVLAYLPCALLDRLCRLMGMRWPRAWMPRGPRELSDSKVLIDLFGIAYADGREKFLPFNVLSNLPAMLFGVPVVKLSQALGGFKGRWNRFVARWMLSRCMKVFARGDESLAMCRDLGLDAKRIDVAADTAFAFREADVLTSENPGHEAELVGRLEQLRAAGRRVLVLGVSAVVQRKCRQRGVDYTSVMHDVAAARLAAGWAVLLLPHATREDTESLHNNDLPVIGILAAALAAVPGADRLVCVQFDLNTASLRRVLAGGDVLVASRFHAMIAGLVLGMPTLVLGSGHQYREVLAQFGMEAWSLDHADLDAATLAARIDALVEEETSIRQRLQERLAGTQALAARQFAWLHDFLAPDLAVSDEAEGAET